MSPSIMRRLAQPFAAESSLGGEGAEGLPADASRQERNPPSGGFMVGPVVLQHAASRLQVASPRPSWLAPDPRNLMGPQELHELQSQRLLMSASHQPDAVLQHDGSLASSPPPAELAEEICQGCGLAAHLHRDLPRYRLRQIPLEYQAARGWFAVRLAESDGCVDPHIPYGRSFSSVPDFLRALQGQSPVPPPPPQPGLHKQGSEERKSGSQAAPPLERQSSRETMEFPASFYPIWNRQWLSQNHRWSRHTASQISAGFSVNPTLILNPETYGEFLQFL